MNPDIVTIGVQPEEGASIPGIRKWPEEYIPKIFSDENIDQLKRELLLACKQNNALKAKQALTAYLTYYKECVSKDSSIKALTYDSALKNAMEALDYYLYADHKLETNDREKTPWNGQALKSAVENTDAQSNQQPPSKKILAPLYPE